jgi:hypothetical protein
MEAGEDGAAKTRLPGIYGWTFGGYNGGDA